MSFAYPLAFLLPLALFALRLYRHRQPPAVPFPRTSLMHEITPSLKLRLRGPVLGGLSIAAVALLSIAAARPQRIRAIEEPIKSRNIMLALDVSKSMATVDFQMGYRAISRFFGVKQVVSEFIKSREKDRIGVVVFGRGAYVQAPLTLDHTLVAQLVERLEVGVAGDGTAIGDGLGLSLKRLAEIPAEAKAVVLMTDGVSNAGQVNPLKAAKVARNLGVKVHTIGIGSVQDRSPLALGGSLVLGQVMRGPGTEFDEETLKKVAEITGGVYFNANSIQGLQQVYQEIEKLESSEGDDPLKEIPSELFMDYALAGALCYLLYALLANSYFLKLP